jgi:M6 family metalloprotease-like protein
VVVLGRSHDAHARAHALRARSLEASSGRTPGPVAAGTPAEPRPFPHDLFQPGATRPALKPVRTLIREGLAAAAADPNPDTVRVALMRVDFLRDSRGATTTTPDGRFDLRTDTGVLVDPPPHNKAYFEAHARALADYYRAQSYGSMVIDVTVFPAAEDSAYHLADTGDYGPWEVSQNAEVVQNATSLVTDAVMAAAASGDFRFDDFDAYVVAHAGADYQSDVNRDTPDDIPTFTLSLADSIDTGTGKVGRVLVMPETSVQDGFLGALNGTFAHEFGHVLGLPDLYNICNGLPQVGWWSLMDSGENIFSIIADVADGDTLEYEAAGVFPTSFDPWCKLQLFPKAVAPLMIGESWQAALEAVELNPEIPYVSLDPTETFLVENRALDLDGNGFPFVRADSTTGVFLGPVDDPEGSDPVGHLEYDAVLPGGGILIWHVDDKILLPALAGQDLGYGCPGGINLFTGFRGLALVEADGISDLGRPALRRYLGSPDDPFYLDNNALFAPNTVPGTEANDGAFTGIRMEITSNPARVMGIKIERPLTRDGWPRLLPYDDEVKSNVQDLAVLDLDTGFADSTPEILFTLDQARTGPPPATYRGLGAIRADATPYVDTLFARANARILGMASSSSFVLTAGQPEERVIALTQNGGAVDLWKPGGSPLIRVAGPTVTEPAQTPPVIATGGSGPGRILYGTQAGLVELTPRSGTMDYDESLWPVTGTGGALPVGAPALTPYEEGPFPVGSAGGYAFLQYAAQAYQGGWVEFFYLVDPGENVWSHRFSTDVAHILGCYIDPADFGLDPNLYTGSAFAVFTEDTVAVMNGDILAAWKLPAPVTAPPALGDLDGDGEVEIVAVTDAGGLFAWNVDGSPALGWPRTVKAPVRDLKLADLDGDGRLDVLVLDHNGRFIGFDGRGKLLPDYPRACGTYPVRSAWLAELDPADPGRGLTWVATLDNGALIAQRFPEARVLTGDWRMPGGRPEGGNVQDAVPSQNVRGPDLGKDRLLVYPNPARGDGVEIRFLLDSGETAKLTLLDLTGRELTGPRLDRRSGFHSGENAARWDLHGVAPGLYFCRLERRGSRGKQVDLAKIVVLR